MSCAIILNKIDESISYDFEKTLQHYPVLGCPIIRVRMYGRLTYGRLICVGYTNYSGIRLMLLDFIFIVSSFVLIQRGHFCSIRICCMYVCSYVRHFLYLMLFYSIVMFSILTPLFARTPTQPTNQNHNINTNTNTNILIIILSCFLFLTSVYYYINMDMNFN